MIFITLLALDKGKKSSLQLLVFIPCVLFLYFLLFHFPIFLSLVSLANFYFLEQRGKEEVFLLIFYTSGTLKHYDSRFCLRSLRSK